MYRDGHGDRAGRGSFGFLESRGPLQNREKGRGDGQEKANTHALGLRSRDGGFGMRRFCIVVLVVVLLAFGSVASAVEPKTIPGWADLRQDMELFKGALKQAVGYTVLNTYLPGYGVVFMFTAKNGDVGVVQREVERALRFIAPTISLLPEGEKISVVGYYDGFNEWELVYVSRVGTSADPATWDVYINKIQR